MLKQEDEAVLHRRAFRKIVQKLDKRIIPFIALLEISRFGFQVAISKYVRFLN